MITWIQLVSFEFYNSGAGDGGECEHSRLGIVVDTLLDGLPRPRPDGQPRIERTEVVATHVPLPRLRSTTGQSCRQTRERAWILQVSGALYGPFTPCCYLPLVTPHTAILFSCRCKSTAAGHQNPFEGQEYHAGFGLSVI